jgi:phosphoribosyl-ATP pyrophosphohydrolase/phosphoribosyl-AMP cyclohydrolase
MSLSTQVLDELDFTKGLLPAIVQHSENGTVLMLGYMNREALEATLARGRVVFFSRSKHRLWEKGETSGNALEVAEVRADCDRDALLIAARPQGPTCHLGTASCFGESAPTDSEPLKFLSALEAIISERLSVRPHDSYTARLVAGGTKRIAQKVGEEGLELALAAAAGTNDEVVAEAADLLYHLLVLLKTRALALDRVIEALRLRHAARSGSGQEAAGSGNATPGA